MKTKKSEQARSEILDALRLQSERDNIKLSTALWTLLNDHENARLSPDEIGVLLDQIGDEEDQAVQLLERYEKSISKNERKRFRKRVKVAATRKEYLSGFLSYVEFEDPSLSGIPRWLDVILLFASAILFVVIMTALAFEVPSSGTRGDGHWYDSHTTSRFFNENPVMVWIGKLAVLALFAYAIQFFVLKAWSRLRSG